MEAIVQMIPALVVLPLTIWLIWKLFVIVGDMAERRGQNRGLWIVVALLINPLSAMVLLWLFCPVSRA
jgi:hypothetical protein